MSLGLFCIVQRSPYLRNMERYAYDMSDTSSKPIGVHPAIEAMIHTGHCDTGLSTENRIRPETLSRKT